MIKTEETKTAKVDRRILRTRHALRTTLMELVKEKDFDSISVEEIAERANISRATFYLHYKDKEDLLLEEFSMDARERVKMLSELPASVWVKEMSAAKPDVKPILPLLKIFEHAAENINLYRIALRSRSSQKLVSGIRQITTQAFNEFLNAKLQDELLELRPAVPVDLLAAYFSGALLNTLGWWLEQEPRMSPEEITHTFNLLFFPGVKKAFGLENFPV